MKLCDGRKGADKGGESEHASEGTAELTEGCSEATLPSAGKVIQTERWHEQRPRGHKVHVAGGTEAERGWGKRWKSSIPVSGWAH